MIHLIESEKILQVISSHIFCYFISFWTVSSLGANAVCYPLYLVGTQ
jgi:hypothetical protein